MAEVPCVRNELFVPTLDEVAEALQTGLSNNFSSVSVSVTDCPDLTAEPFGLPTPGLGGDVRAVDVGGPPYLLPLVKREKVYDIADVAQRCSFDCGLVVGPGAGPWQVIGKNSELIARVKMGSEPAVMSKVAKISDETGKGEQIDLDTTRFALMANLFMSRGQPGKVLEIKASKRTGMKNFMVAVRDSLSARFGEKPVVLGGTFLIESGTAKLHIMPEFSTCPLTSNEDLNNWLTFHESPAPLVALGYLVSHDPGWDLRIEHFHCISINGVGGHYHYDVSPDEVSYRAYFNVAETLYRYDAPVTTHQIGRD